MCYSAIIPTTTKSTKINVDVMKVIYVFNRWQKMLTRYGQLDSDTLYSDLASISKVVKGADLKDPVKKAVVKCRNYALGRGPFPLKIHQSIDKCSQKITRFAGG